MVKGISRQVIVVHSPDQRLFEQAIFILKDSAVDGKGITDEALIKEANRLIRSGKGGSYKGNRFYGPAWAACGAAITAGVWALTTFF